MYFRISFELEVTIINWNLYDDEWHQGRLCKVCFPLVGLSHVPGFLEKIIAPLCESLNTLLAGRNKDG